MKKADHWTSLGIWGGSPWVIFVKCPLFPQLSISVLFALQIQHLQKFPGAGVSQTTIVGLDREIRRVHSSLTVASALPGRLCIFCAFNGCVFVLLDVLTISSIGNIRKRDFCRPTGSLDTKTNTDWKWFLTLESPTAPTSNSKKKTTHWETCCDHNCCTIPELFLQHTKSSIRYLPTSSCESRLKTTIHHKKRSLTHVTLWFDSCLIFRRSSSENGDCDTWLTTAKDLTRSRLRRRIHWVYMVCNLK